MAILRSFAIFFVNSIGHELLLMFVHLYSLILNDSMKRVLISNKNAHKFSSQFLCADCVLPIINFLADGDTLDDSV